MSNAMKFTSNPEKLVLMVKIFFQNIFLCKLFIEKKFCLSQALGLRKLPGLWTVNYISNEDANSFALDVTITPSSGFEQ